MASLGDELRAVIREINAPCLGSIFNGVRASALGVSAFMQVGESTPRKRCSHSSNLFSFSLFFFGPQPFFFFVPKQCSFSIITCAMNLTIHFCNESDYLLLQ